MELIVIHLEKSASEQSRIRIQGEPALVFETCLRTIKFYTPARTGFQDVKELITQDFLVPQNNIKSDHDAYAFLLEVLCGAHSVMSWETEVLGQFKLFLKSNEDRIRELALTEWFDSLLSDVKDIRRQYLQKMGLHSYGSITRKLTARAKGVALLGRGQLASEIAPWLSKKDHRVLLVRDTEKVALSQLNQFTPELVASSAPLLGIESLIIAAPVSNSEIEYVVGKLPSLFQIIDWRGDSVYQPKRNHLSIHSLRDIEPVLDSQREKDAEMKIKIGAVINQKSIKFLNRVKHNPWGWEDFSA